MSSALKLEARTFPSRIADLGFTARLPGDWIAHELPPESPDFSNPATFFPLAVVTAPHAAIVFAFAARPAYEDGTLHDWAWFLLQHNQLKPRAVGPRQLGSLPAVVGEATQESELGLMVVRFAFFEDGGRLVNITLTAPELLADTVRETWFALLDSFTLTTPRGSRFAPGPTAAAESPPSSATVAEAPSAPVPAPERKNEARPADVTFARFALADTGASLDEAHPVNVSLRDRGAGLVPNVIATDDMEKFAIVAAGSILAQFRVPFGWHVVDDGKRALVFEAQNEIQISLHLLAREGRDNPAVLDDLEAEARASHPHPEFMRMKEGRIEALGVRGIADGGQPLEQYHLLYPAPQPHLVLHARVTAVPPRSADALNLSELILRSAEFAGLPGAGDASAEPGGRRSEKSRRKALVRALEPPACEGLPPQHEVREVKAADGRISHEVHPSSEWWQRALALEADGQLKAAEQVIADHVPHLGYAASTAEMYRLRMNRLKQAGDMAGALAAFRKADRFIWSYASMATSGGEGMALSLERDAFRARLVAEYGSDPEAGP